jgi:hypothetical protein
MSSVAIKRYCREDMGPIQDRFRNSTSGIPANQPNCQQSGFHSANMMIEQSRPESMNETAKAIAQLATATASDRSTVATLTTRNAKLASQLEAANALIAQLKNEIATIKNKIKPVWQGQRPVRTTNNDSYCWSHCYQVAKSHTSATCNMKKSGHQDAAIKSNTMGGVQWGKE